MKSTASRDAETLTHLKDAAYTDISLSAPLWDELFPSQRRKKIKN